TSIQIPGGQAIDRLGARRLAFAALVTICVGNGLALIVSDPALALSTRALTGLGTGIGFIAGSDYVRAAGGSPLAQGLFGGFGVAGGGFALAVVPQLERAVGWPVASCPTGRDRRGSLPGSASSRAPPRARASLPRGRCRWPSSRR